jgi:hypothetical protein
MVEFFRALFKRKSEPVASKRAKPKRAVRRTALPVSARSHSHYGDMQVVRYLSRIGADDEVIEVAVRVAKRDRLRKDVSQDSRDRVLVAH